MITTIKEFQDYWTMESGNTRKIMNALTDKSLGQKVTDDHRTLGRLAWHITQSISEMASRTGLSIDGPDEHASVPQSSETIKKAYNRAASSLLEQVTGKWDDRTLQVEDDMYGEKWKRGVTLMVLIAHENHHRAQMTVLMRQAGLRVPGIYGPSKDEWANIGMKPPEV
jgi:uncharacterized damage-inducible protein DinB